MVEISMRAIVPKFGALTKPIKDEMRILRSLNGCFQKFIDFINTEDSVLLILEKVTPHPNDDYVTTTLYDVIKTEAARQSKLQVSLMIYTQVYADL